MGNKTLKLILGDQLNQKHSWFDEVNSSTTFVLMEVRQETDYANHHIQKVLAIFAAMRSFTSILKKIGHNVIYFNLNDKSNKQNILDNLLHIIHTENITHFEYQEPDEYRLDELLTNFCASLPITSLRVSSEHFLTERNDLAEIFAGKKTYLMETFYRKMRKRYGILMRGENPEGGQWNFDADNRNKLPSSHRAPEPLVFAHNLSSIHQMIVDAGVLTIGNVDAKSVIWPIDRNESLQLLDYFLKNCLVFFGKFQDALSPQQWSLYHSRISFSLNTKMISPAEVCHAAENYWRNNQDEITLAQAEGFIRQILGWREFMRGVYWAQMPSYASLNFFNHTNKLPDWYWTGNTKMHCLRHSINQSLDFAYAHHIQRLMVTGNFALLAGTHPDEVDAWYLGIYIDAIEWVEITNTRGMSQFADGGLIATKPYVSSANYINKMGHYCDGCYYDKNLKTGPRACPFNSLYWHFMDRHRSKLEKNPRIGMAYKTWDKMAPDAKADIIQQADAHLKNIDSL